MLMADRTQSDLQGYGSGVGKDYVPRRHAPPEMPIHVRRSSGITANDIELAPMKYIALALTHLHEQLATAAKTLQDHSKPVDTYQLQTLIPDVETTLIVQPAYEGTERITSILITGPAGAVTVQLGDRVWPLVIPATQFLIIAPVQIELERSDVRQLIAATPGDYNLELMGFADTRAGNM